MVLVAVEMTSTASPVVSHDTVGTKLGKTANATRAMTAARLSGISWFVVMAVTYSELTLRTETLEL